MIIGFDDDADIGVILGVNGGNARLNGGNVNGGNCNVGNIGNVGIGGRVKLKFCSVAIDSDIVIIANWRFGFNNIIFLCCFGNEDAN